MDKQSICRRLQALAQNNQKRSKAARLREIFDDVETTLAAGVTHAAVLAELNACGLDLSLPTFNTMLQRLRRQRNKSVIAPPGNTTSIVAPADSAVDCGSLSASIADGSAITMDTRSENTGSHDPAQLDAIFNSTPDLAALAKLVKKRIS
jgi:hypothetical protein